MMNKKTALATVLCAACALSAAAQNKLSTNHLQLLDSTRTVVVKLTVDYPDEGHSPLAVGVRRAILDRLSHPAEAPAVDAFEALTPVLNAYCDNLHASLREAREAAIETGDDADDMALPYRFEAEATLVHETDRYATYRYTAFTYAGGAHGMQSSQHFTIESATGAELDWDSLVAPGPQREALAALVRTALAEQYYAPLGAEPGYDESPDVFSFALPAVPPALVQEGLVLTYQPYEIDCYAAGMPTCTLPYSDVRPLMTPRAKALVRVSAKQ